MPELGYKPVNKYLPPRPGRMPRNSPTPSSSARPRPTASAADGLLRWVDRLLSR
jgi:hypothetical protein